MRTKRTIHPPMTFYEVTEEEMELVENRLSGGRSNLCRMLASMSVGETKKTDADMYRVYNAVRQWQKRYNRKHAVTSVDFGGTKFTYIRRLEDPSKDVEE